jgi:integrase
VLLAANTGMRIGEIRNVRFCDIEFRMEFDERFDKKAEVLVIKNIVGKRNKRGTGICKSFFGAVRPFERCMERDGLNRENYKQSQELVFKEYHRDLFRQILEKTGLRYTNSRPPLKRDLASLRATYICMALKSGVPVWDVANNCRNSFQVIQSNYAAHLGIENSTQINRRTIRTADGD